MFDDNKLYYATDPALRALAARQTLAHWRHEGRGPDYIKVGARVAYLGSALNRWLASRTVTPKAA